MVSTYLDLKLKEEYDDLEYSKIVDGYKCDRYLTLRVNTIKSNKEEIIKVFNDNNINYEKVSFYKDAFVIKNKNILDIQKLSIYEDGKIYIQSLSSMIPPLILNPLSNENILDMTAAPGSKTSEMAALSNNMALIMAVEKDKIRCDRLKYNLEKLGVKKVNVINSDSSNLDENYKFDKILLDAPCTGVGTINENDDIKIDEDILKRSTNRQIKLINKAIKLLKKGGILVYSTCSILKEENEYVIEETLKSDEVELIKIDNFDRIDLLKTDIDGTLCICPNKYFEGFYVAMLKKL